MKKTLIAASIAALATATSAAHASVTLYENEEGTSSLSSYGRIALQLQNFDGENEIQDSYSRFGFSGESQINDDLTAFANAEFRFNSGFTHDAAMTTRYTFVGVEGGFGKITAGNFDSVYYSTVAGNADLMEELGWRTMDNKGEGFSLAYESMDFNGLQLHLGLRHYNSEDSRSGTAYPSYSGGVDEDGDVITGGDEEWNVQVGLTYALNDALTFGFAFDQNNEDTPDGGADPIFALSATYAVDAYSAFAVFEMEDDAYIINLGGSYTYGPGDIYGMVSFKDDGTDNNNTGVDFALGANYLLGDNFYTFAEFALGNDDVSEIQDADDDGTVAVTLGAVYTW